MLYIQQYFLHFSLFNLQYFSTTVQTIILIYSLRAYTKARKIQIRIQRIQYVSLSKKAYIVEPL